MMDTQFCSGPTSEEINSGTTWSVYVQRSAKAGGIIKVTIDVDSHLEAIPSLGSLSARSLTGGDTQHLGGHANGSLEEQEELISKGVKIQFDNSVVNGPRMADEKRVPCTGTSESTGPGLISHSFY